MSENEQEMSAEERARRLPKALKRLQQLLEIEEKHKSYGSLAEAANAAVLIQELLTKYKLELSNVERAAEEESNPMTSATLFPSDYGFTFRESKKGEEGTARVQWAEMLADAVALAYFCQCLVALDSNILWLVGRSTDVDIAQGVFYRLARTALALCERDREAAKKRAQRGNYIWIGNDAFRRSFLFGFADAIKRRLEAKRAELDAQAGQSTALIVTRGAVTKYVEETIQPKQTDSLETPELDFEALKLGMIRGHEANIEGADLTQAPENKQLG